MKNIVLTGYMASGKSTIGAEIAKMTGLKLVDTDALVEKNEGLSISDIFEKFGEEYFRDREAEACREAAEENGAVIATGGGAVLRSENIQALRRNGIIFNLEPSAALIGERLASDSGRPLVKGAGLDEILNRFYERRRFYDDCDCKIFVSNSKTPREHAMEIMTMMKEKLEEI